MVLTCERCGHTGPPGRVDVVDGQVALSCAQCGAASTLSTGPGASPTPPGAVLMGSGPPPPAQGEGDRHTAPPSARGGLPPEAEGLPPVKCPKCGHRQHDRVACHACGLDFARAATGDRPWERPPPGQERQYAQVEEAWRGLGAQWGDAAAHDAFLELSRSVRLSTLAAQRYRSFLADRPGEPHATRALARATHDAAVLVQSFGRPAGDVREQTRAVRAGLYFALAAMLLVVVFALVRLSAAGRAYP